MFSRASMLALIFAVAAAGGIRGNTCSSEAHPVPTPNPPQTGDVRAVELGGGVKLDLVWIPPGEFVMGSSFDEDGRAPMESFRHPVRLTRGFWMGRYPVTQEQWERVTGGNPSYTKGPSLPVEQVNWSDCQNFLQQINSILESGHLTAALPTEAQWEYACRAGTQTRYYLGDNVHDLDRTGWFSGNSGYKPHPVGQKEKNKFGLHDMHGNVWQWCQDWMDAYPRTPSVDPTGPDSGNARVLRGGSWGSDQDACRSACRFCYPPDYRIITAGLRIVAMVDPKEVRKN
ncbi:MAG: formylglycine-generating enzyme family protein [Verrucomicrobiaceae bacterium]